MNVLLNPGFDAGWQGGGSHPLFDPALRQAARDEIAGWPHYAPTPLRDLREAAAALGIGRLLCKDESQRFGLGSFKALGGAYAVRRLVAANPQRELTVACASEGNHGRAVAWGARQFGCRCVVFLAERVAADREQAIRALGADVVRTAGVYDDAVRDAARAAEEHGWHLVADTSDVPDATVPTDVMLGYTVLAAEAVDQLPRGSAISHVVVQAGVGGLAAAVTAYFLSSGLPHRPPTIIVAEPEAADCCRRSALAGERVTVPGGLQTRMAGLNCGEVSAAAWPILRRGVSAFATISDDEALASIERFAAGAEWEGGQRGTAGAAGLAAVAALAGTVAGSRLGLDRDAQVLVIRTEG